MAFWTRFGRKQDKLLEGSAPGPQGLKQLWAVLLAKGSALVRTRLFWGGVLLVFLMAGSATLWSVYVQPWLVRADRRSQEPPPMDPELMRRRSREPVKTVQLPEIELGMTRAYKEAVEAMKVAKLHQEAGRLEQAVNQYKQAISLVADSDLLAAAYTNMAVALDDLEDHHQAVQFLQRAIDFNPSLVEAYHNLGIVYLHMHDFPRARIAFEAAVRLEPDYAPSESGLGEHYLTLTQYADAVAHFSRSLELRESADVRLNLGLSYLLKGDRANAIMHFQQLERHPSDTISYLAAFNLAYALEQDNAFDSAVIAYRRALTRRPDDNDARFNLALILDRTGESNEAVALFRQVLQRDPDHFDAYMNAATLESRRGRFSDALAIIEPVYRRVPNDPEVVYFMASLLHRLGRYSDAERLLLQNIDMPENRLAPDLLTSSISALALVYDDSGPGTYDSSVFYYRSALARTPQEPYLHYNLARVFRKQKRLMECLSEAKLAVEINPKEYTYLLFLAESFYENEDLQQAFEAYRNALSLDPDKTYPRFMLAFTAAQLGRRESAFDEYHRLLEYSLSPSEEGTVYKNVGNLHYQGGQFADALQWFRRAAPLLKNDAQLFYNIALTHYRLGQMDETYVALKRSIEIDPRSSPAHTLLGTYFFKKGLMDRSYDSFKQAVALDVENLEANYNLEVVNKLR